MPILYEAERVHKIERPAPLFMKTIERLLYDNGRNLHGVIGWCHNKKWGWVRFSYKMFHFEKALIRAALFWGGARCAEPASYL